MNSIEITIKSELNKACKGIDIKKMKTGDDIFNYLCSILFENSGSVEISEVKQKKISKTINKEDFCKALKKDGKQCTKKKSNNCDFCSIHSKMPAYNISYKSKDEVNQL